ncbi:hypothetical protein ASALC70_04397 [Alcanivorax sp. ALC70]|nr:hypothetical protein ASALC70_04397 [Alcanivorax sp. ALC70]
MRLFVALLGLLLSLSAAADPVRVAVAANFAKPLETLVALYQRDHPDADIETTVASTGKLAAQIRRGAPFDIFLAADARRPRNWTRKAWAWTAHGVSTPWAGWPCGASRTAWTWARRC